MDLTTVALAQCIINAWKEYKKFESELIKRLESRGFTETDSWDAESFVSDRVVGDEVKDGCEFEKEVIEHLKKQNKK